MREPLAQLLERTFSTTEREVIYRLMRSCGRVRHFTADPIPIETFQRILDAALEAPFVGKLPSWRIILVSSPTLRAAISATVAMGPESDGSTCSDEHGQGLSGVRPDERLVQAPLHLALTCDRGRGGLVGLNRALGPSTDIYRICWAIQNLWLAACAEGLGVEWLRLADEVAVARLLALPASVQLVAYLRMGFPQTFHRRPRRAALDRRARHPFAQPIYTDIWGGHHEP